MEIFGIFIPGFITFRFFRNFAVLKFLQDFPPFLLKSIDSFVLFFNSSLRFAEVFYIMYPS